ncbi:MAG: BMP family ABC transporter substrate-binding protein [Anaerolineae bacterium]|nr:BMP family ABC transporter substrate-binding protein [Anaerolineae bacterium]
MIRKVLALAIVMVLMTVAVVAPARTTAQDEPLKIILVVNGVLGDQSFFDSAQRGMDWLINDGYNVEINTVELGVDEINWESGLGDVMANTDDYDLLITGTWQMGDFLGSRVHLYPDKYFVMYDASVPYDNPEICADGCTNVYTVMYAQNEGSLLAGVYAAAITTSGLEGANDALYIGAVGGQDIPVINDFIIGYEQGACLVNPEVTNIVQYAGGWNDPAAGKEIALAMYEQEADIIFQVAGGTGVGVFEAAKESGHYAIGVDSDQGVLYSSPDEDLDLGQNILTSMLKNVDNSLYRAVDMFIEGELAFGEVEVLGVAEGGVGLAFNDIYFDSTPEYILDLVDAVEEAMLNGEIPVLTVFEDRLYLGYEMGEVGQGCEAMPEVEFDASMYVAE